MQILPGDHFSLLWRHSCCISSVKFYEKFHYLLDSLMFAMLPAPNYLIIELAIQLYQWTRLLPLAGNPVTAAVMSQWLWRHTCWTPWSLEISVHNQINISWNDPVLNSILTGLSSSYVPGKRIPIGMPPTPCYSCTPGASHEIL